ncbi:stage III sporulation protein AE [Tumebacillus permanentifrigoris]|uniref:Stage III sporulation protein AE n=1 Tax=Tumebacillus permanentifrigoris TaxID=378543 RepID=A0A316D7V0_9BACL|nr:stage III sporulation protein AE [Tumebacillus permanentifrigoris]PWK11501.1 stage III sporulation protein AE [Tumebacillus permanentifrigoris]
MRLNQKRTTKTRYTWLFTWLALMIAVSVGNLTSAYAEGTSPPPATQTVPTTAQQPPQQSPSASLTDPLVEQQLSQLDLHDFDQFMDEIVQEYGDYLPAEVKGHVGDLVLHGHLGTVFQGLLTGLIKYLFHELFLNSRLLGTIIVLAVFAAILENMQTAFEGNNVSKIAHTICFLVLMLLAVQSFAAATGYAKDAISTMVDFMTATIPMYLALLASTGGVASAAMIHPLIVFLINVIGDLIQYVIFPLIFFSAILNLVSKLSSRYQVTQLAGFLKTTAVWIMGVFFTIFLGVVSVQGAAGAVADGVSLKAAKYVSSNFVPIVGKLFSDAADTVVGASLIVKNALGITGAGVLLLLAAFPAIKILSLAIVYNVSAAIMQPLGNSPIIACLSTIGKSLILVFAALATVGFMFFLAVTVIIAAGNLSVMVR